MEPLIRSAIGSCSMFPGLFEIQSEHAFRHPITVRPAPM